MVGELIASSVMAEGDRQGFGAASGRRRLPAWSTSASDVVVEAWMLRCRVGQGGRWMRGGLAVLLLSSELVGSSASGRRRERGTRRRGPHRLFVWSIKNLTRHLSFLRQRFTNLTVVPNREELSLVVLRKFGILSAK